MQGTHWVIVDTETDGLFEPIHVVELSAQLMNGWEAVGTPFRMLLNHEVPIPAEATAIHGYTREHLRRHGHDPCTVHELFREYARDYPIVAHNLSFDWDRTLAPEWARLGVARVGTRGFCTMMLARRLDLAVSSYRLDVLKRRFELSASRSHQALNDVLTVVELFHKVYRPRLESAGFSSFDTIAAFSRKTPVARCWDAIRAKSRVSHPNAVTARLRVASQWPSSTRNRASGPDGKGFRCRGSLTFAVKPVQGSRRLRRDIRRGI